MVQDDTPGALSDFHPGRASAFDFQEEMEKLLPDTKAQTIRLQARVADSELERPAVDGPLPAAAPRDRFH